MKHQILIGLVLFFLLGFFVDNSYAASKTLQKSFSYSLTTNPHDSLSVAAPNVFTPNGDGINDTWSIVVHDYGIALFDLQTTVYDRWGREVFQTTNIREVWAGHNLLGKACDNGTYFYVVSYTNGATSNPEVIKGFIELVR